MRRNFEELQLFLHAHYPVLREADSIKGELYPPPPMARALATAGSYMQMTGVLAVFGGAIIFDKLGVPEVYPVPLMRANPMPAVVGLSVVNYVCSSFLATGAFEVTIDGELVFSRLEEKNFPSGAVIMRALEERGVRSTRAH